MIYEIKELISFAEKTIISKNLKDKITNLGSKRAHLYNIILSNDTLIEQDICMEIYACYNYRAFHKLKKRLYHSLIEIVFCDTKPEIDRNDSYNSIQNTCIKNTALLKIIRTKRLLKNIEYLGKNTLKHCEKHGFSGLAREILVILLNYYGAVVRDQNNFNKYYEKYKFYLEESTTFEMLTILYSEKAGKQEELRKHDKSELKKIFKIDFVELKLADPKSTFQVKFYCYQLMCLYLEVSGQFKQLVLLAQNAIKFMQQSYPNDSANWVVFVNYTIHAQLKLKLYEEIKSTVTIQLPSIPKNSISRIVLQIYHTLTLIHTKDYYEAYERLLETKKALKGKKIAPQLRELTELYHGYIFIVNKAYELSIPNLKLYNLGKLMNNVPKYSKDKRGQNISILILQFLILLERQKYDDLIDKIDALKQYSYRHLRKNDTFRSNCFIKMLLQLPKAGFNPIRTERYTKDLYARLQSVPLEISDQPMEIEIIPYEDLWGIIMELLKRNNKVRRGRPRKTS